MLKQILAVCAGVLLGVAVFAAEVELRADHPDTYVVQKGDTLWDISARFLNAPWLWPEIWQANPQVENPHLIYPGDVLNLVYLDGRPILVRDGKLSPRIRADDAEAITTIPLSDIQAFLKSMRLLTQDEVDHLPYVVALEENRLRSTTGQIAYVRGLDATPGTTVFLLRPTYVYWDVPEHFPWDSSPRTNRVEEWSSDRSETLPRVWDRVARHHAYRQHVEYLGHEVIEIGVGEVLRSGDPATVLVQYGDFEVKKGDLLTLAAPAPFDLTFYPRAPDAVPPNFRVLAFSDALNAVGPRQVVALNKGARDGVENGETYAVYEPGDVVKDTVKYGEADLRTTFKPSKANVRLPEEFVGHVMIFRTFDKISYGLMMDGIRPIHLYDVLHEPVY